MKKLLCILLVLTLSVSLIACGGNSGSKGKDKTQNNSNGKGSASATMGKLPDNPPEKPSTVAVGENGSRTDDPVGFQLELPEIGEKIVVFETTKGNIYMRLFPESAPITVTNFVGLVEAGYYDGITFHRVINDFMIQGGDPEGTGMGGESVWGGKFEDEFNANLLNIRGSLSMANSGTATNGSQFFINQGKSSTNKSYYDYETLYEQLYSANAEALKQEYNTYINELKGEYPDADSYVKGAIDQYIGRNAIFTDDVSEEAWKLYKENGGNIHLDGAFKRGHGGHSVFAQVFSGMSVVDAIAGVEVDANDKPTTDVVITKAYTTTVTEEILALADPKEDKTTSGVVIPN